MNKIHHAVIASCETEPGVITPPEYIHARESWNPIDQDRAVSVRHYIEDDDWMLSFARVEGTIKTTTSIRLTAEALHAMQLCILEIQTKEEN